MGCLRRSSKALFIFSGEKIACIVGSSTLNFMVNVPDRFAAYKIIYNFDFQRTPSRGMKSSFHPSPVPPQHLIVQHTRGKRVPEILSELILL